LIVGIGSEAAGRKVSMEFQKLSSWQDLLT